MSAEDGTKKPLGGERRTDQLQPIESLARRIERYLPPAEILAMTPSPVDVRNREAFQATRPGDAFALVYYPPEKRLIMVPSDHPLNRTPQSANIAVYGTGSMETLSFEPIQGEQGTIEGANIVLLGDRMDRLYDRALPSREITTPDTALDGQEAAFPVDRSTLGQGITDLMAVLGTHVLAAPDGAVGIGSIRVTVGPGMGKFGKRAVGQEVSASVESYRTGMDFSEVARNGTGLTVAAGPDQRTMPFRGKHSSQYGDAPRIAEAAKRVGGADAIEFAEFFAHDSEQTAVLDRIKDPDVLRETMLDLALANGLGAELMAVRQEEDGSQTLLLPPMDVKRLGGVTAQYIVDHMAPAMGIRTAIEPFCLRDILDGKITGLFYAGNAARIAQISTVRLHTADEKVLGDIHIPVPDVLNQLVARFEAEVTGAIPPSHPSLVTRVDLEDGRQARQILEQAYANWLHPSEESTARPHPQRRSWRSLWGRIN